MKKSAFRRTVKAHLAKEDQKLEELDLKEGLEQHGYDEDALEIVELMCSVMSSYTEQVNDKVLEETRDIKKNLENHSHVDGEVHIPLQ